MPKVTMSLTEQDAKNADFIQNATNAPTKAHSISISLSLTAIVLERVREGYAEIILRNAEGQYEKVSMREIEDALRSAGATSAA